MMTKKPVQIIVIILIAIMFIATIIITIVLKPPSNNISTNSYNIATSISAKQTISVQNQNCLANKNYTFGTLPIKESPVVSI